MNTCNKLPDALKGMNYARFAEEILQHWSVLDIPNNDGVKLITILRLACTYTDLKALVMLLEAGANPNFKYPYSANGQSMIFIYDSDRNLMGVREGDAGAAIPRTCAEHLRADCTQYGMEITDNLQQCLDLLAAPPSTLSWDDFAQKYGCSVAVNPCAECIVRKDN